MDTKNLFSIGKACSIIQVMPDRITAAAAALGVEPHMVVDGVIYFTAGDLGKITAHLRELTGGDGMIQRWPMY